MIDENKLLEWLNAKAKERDTAIEYCKARGGVGFGILALEQSRAKAIYCEVIGHIQSQRAELASAHARIDKARKANAKPIEQDFVFPLTLEGEREWNEQAEQLRQLQNEFPGLGEHGNVRVRFGPSEHNPCRDSRSDVFGPIAERKPVRCCDDDCGEQRTLRLDEQNE